MEEQLAVVAFRWGVAGVALLVSFIALFVSFRAVSRAEASPTEMQRSVVDKANLAHSCALALEETLRSHINRENAQTKKVNGGNGGGAAETVAMIRGEDGQMRPSPYAGTGLVR